jgi:hypothetical protein
MTRAAIVILGTGALRQIASAIYFHRRAGEPEAAGETASEGRRNPG